MNQLSHGAARSGADQWLPDRSVRPTRNEVIASFEAVGVEEWARLGEDVDRLLADDGVTYTPVGHPLVGSGPGHQAPAAAAVVDPVPWQLDPVPWVLDGREWQHLSLGLAQRAELLQLIMTDLYTEQRLLTEGLIPPLAIVGHPEYLRPLVDPDAPPDAHRLVLTGADLGRDPDRTWRFLADHTQAPSGAGYAMQNRRVISRVLPQQYRAANLFRLTPFFHALRVALVDAAPRQTEDPRVVVLSPGTHSETAFDQAFLAQLLGFPLVEGADLTVADGRVWLRSVGRREPVDVILRRVDGLWTDPLELRPGSRLGVAGLVDCVRRGTVTVVNALGAGVLENPALLPFLPRLCTELLGEELRIDSVPTWWCGEPGARAEVLANLDQLIIAPIHRGDGRGVLGGRLGRRDRDELVDRIGAEPHRFVGQQVMTWDTTPVVDRYAAPLGHRPVVLRSFTVAHGRSFLPMLGGLGQVMPRAESSSVPGGGVGPASVPMATKDVWVVSEPGAPRQSLVWADAVELTGSGVGPGAVMVPRVLDDLFWLGRYAERAEQMLRLVLAVRQVAVERDFHIVPGGDLEVLMRAVRRLSDAVEPGPGREGLPGSAGPGLVVADLRGLLLDRQRSGTVAHSLAALSYTAHGVRDQLSADVWMVLAGIERALTSLRAARWDRGTQLADSGERVLASLLALSGITSENMVRDPGWHLLDAGRGIERALQLCALLQHTLGWLRTTAAERADEEGIIACTLEAAESIVTFRRRHTGGQRLADVVDLLVLDATNPRSVAFQCHRLHIALAALPGPSTSRSRRLCAELLDRLDGQAVADVLGSAPTAAALSPAPGLTEWLSVVHRQIEQVAEAIDEEYLRPPLPPGPLSSELADQP